MIKCIIFDWAGTTIDYGCFAPVNAFISAFKAFGINVSEEETRVPMGLAKRTHIVKMLEAKKIPFSEEDADKIYAKFEPALYKVLENHCEPLPNVLDVVAKLKKMGIKIGSTTGYTKTMMEKIVIEQAKKNGYSPDSAVCPEEVKSGRPFPYMLWKNLENLGISSINEVLKIGDTAVDMEEGKNAGCLSVGILKGSSMVGLSKEEEKQKSDEELAKIHETAKQKFFDAGADFVLNEIAELPDLIEFLNERKEN